MDLLNEIIKTVLACASKFLWEELVKYLKKRFKNDNNKTPTT